MKSDLIIKIPSESSEAQVTLIDHSGIEKHKNIMVDNLVSNLISSFQFSTGLLPRNTRFFSGTPDSYIIGIESPSKVRRFLKKSAGSDIINRAEIPFPTCLFVFLVKGFKLCKSSVFSLHSSVIRDSDTVCRFPFGNTYRSGRICWGNCSLKTSISNPLELTGIVATFFDAPFNGDLFDHYTIKKTKDMTKINFWNLLKYLDGRKIFPKEMLYDMNIKVGDLMKGRLNV